MRRAAETYCELIEAGEGSERVRFVSDAARTLAAAVAAAYRLPDVEWTSGVEGDASSGGIEDERWARHFSEIQGVVGEWGLYWTAPDAYRLSGSTGEPEVDEEFFAENGALRHLADDLADIWRDLRGGLDALDRGAAEDEVTWQWRFDFRTHWGAHAVEALRALHQQVTA